MTNPLPIVKKDEKRWRIRCLTAIRSSLFPVLPDTQWSEAPMRRSDLSIDLGEFPTKKLCLAGKK